LLVSGWQQAVTLLVIIIPGFIFQGTRSRLRGPSREEQEVTVRILQALAMSGFLALLYVVVLGARLTDPVMNPEVFTDHDHHGHPSPPDPRLSALILIVLVFVFPIALAWVFQYCATHFVIVDWCIKRTDRTFSRYDSTPTAWDFAADHMGQGFLRVYTKDNTWLGGRLQEDAYVSGFPEAREVFLNEAWELDEDGVFLHAVPGTAGIWIRCDDVQFVQFLEPGNVGSSRYSEQSLIALPLGKHRKLRVVLARNT
jgi:hypothetical protein